MGETVASRRKGGGAQLRAPRSGWTTAKRNRFLAELAQTMNIRASARAVNLSEQGAYKLRKRDPGFAAAWDEALSDAYDKVEMLLLERALAGLGGDAVAAGDTSKLEKLSERMLLGLLSHHRQAVRGHREARGALPDDDEAGARARLEAKLEEIERRLRTDNDG